MDATTPGTKPASQRKVGVRRDDSPGILARPERFLKADIMTPEVSGSDSGSQRSKSANLKRYSISTDVKITKSGRTLDEATIAIGDEPVGSDSSKSDKRAKSTPILSHHTPFFFNA